MSAGNTSRREIAHRVFACEYQHATHSFTRGDEERAPNYVVLPTGIAVNRLFLVGVLTSVERVNEETVRARVVDPTGAFVVYASQYQPEARARFEDIDPPAFVAVTGKAHTFQPDGSDQVYTSVRPEAVAVVNADTRDRWTVTTAQHTLERLGAMASVLAEETASSEDIERAIQAYEVSPAYLSNLYDTCLDTCRLVAGELDSVDVPSLDLTDPSDPAVSLSAIQETAQALRSSTEDPQPTLEDSPSEDSMGLSPPDGPVLTDDERAEVEDSFDVEFTTGDAIDPPDEEPAGEEHGTDAPDVTADEQESGLPEEPPEAEVDVQESGLPDEPPETVADEQESEEMVEEAADPTDIILSLLEEMSDEGGVERATIVKAAEDRFGLAEPEVTDALQTAMMDGQCYESPTDVFHPV